jgi:hypothetical protein
MTCKVTGGATPLFPQYGFVAWTEHLYTYFTVFIYSYILIQIYFSRFTERLCGQRKRYTVQ